MVMHREYFMLHGRQLEHLEYDSAAFDSATQTITLDREGEKIPVTLSEMVEMYNDLVELMFSYQSRCGENYDDIYQQLYNEISADFELGQEEPWQPLT